MEKNIEKLVNQVVIDKNKEAGLIIRKIAKEKRIIFQSTQKLYEARIQGKWKGFTIPAINIRTLTFDIAKVIFRQVIKKKIGAFIFEIARSEINYTDQSMAEYVTVILAAAISEGFTGYLFIQGDHFQVNAKKFFELNQKNKEITALKKLIKDSIEAGAYNIDLDCSTLVKIEEKDLVEQQKLNYQLTAELTAYIRNLKFPKITISIGGEIGEIGGKNSTPEDLKVFIEHYNKELIKLGIKPGLIKIAIQAGTSHGGIVLPSGEIKKVEIDFNTLKNLAETARQCGLAGIVQHGASTLPEEYFDEFVKANVLEIHLATAFQNIVYNYMPESLKEKIYNWIKKEKLNEKQPDSTEEQFLYKIRKKAFGPFKKEIWSIPQKNKNEILAKIEEKLSFLFQKLNVNNTKEIVDKIYSKR